MTIIHVLCEGQTEEGFVNSVLKPYLLDRGITAVKPVIVCTNKKLDARGGVPSYQYISNNLSLLYKSNVDTSTESHRFTTMLDFYRLPPSFPGYAEAKKISDKYSRVEYIEQEFKNDQAEPRFIPYVQLHEFEALVFCGIPYLKDMYKGSSRNIDSLSEYLSSHPNPELINDGPDTAPSKRIVGAIEDRYRYNKMNAGKYVTGKVGIDELRRNCTHFSNWVGKLVECGNAK